MANTNYNNIKIADYGASVIVTGVVERTCGTCDSEIPDHVRIEEIMSNVTNKRYVDHYCYRIKKGLVCRWGKK